MSTSQQRTSLSRFVDDRHKHIALLGVFSALAALSSQMQGVPVWASLQLLMVALALILWVDLMMTFPPQPWAFLLYLFQALMVLTMIVLLVTWLSTICVISLPTSQITIFVVISSTLYAVARRFVALPKILQPKPIIIRPARIILAVGVLVAASVIAAYVASVSASSFAGQAIRALDGMRQALDMKICLMK